MMKQQHDEKSTGLLFFATILVGFVTEKCTSPAYGEAVATRLTGGILTCDTATLWPAAPPPR